LRSEFVGVIMFDQKEIEADINLVCCWGAANDEIFGLDGVN